MHDVLSSMIYNDVLTKLTGMCYINDIKIHVHLYTMKELWEQLAEIGKPLSDDQFWAYIHASLTPDYWPFFTSLFISAYSTGKLISIEDLIIHIYQEADVKAINKNANITCENAATNSCSFALI